MGLERFGFCSLAPLCATEHWRLNSFLKLDTPRQRRGVQSQNILATFLWLKVRHVSTLVVQFTVTDTQPRISDTVAAASVRAVLGLGRHGVTGTDEDEVAVSAVVGGIPSRSV